MDIQGVLSQMEGCKKIVIWGAGFHTEEVLRIYEDFFKNTELVIVDKNKAGQKIYDIEIQAINAIDYGDVDLVIVMTAFYLDEIELQLRDEMSYRNAIIGLYDFRQQMAATNGNLACKYHMQQFINLMECGTESYSYETIFAQRFSQYRVIKVYAYWLSSIGEGIRYLLEYYYQEFLQRKPDEYYLLMPFIKGNDFANGSFMEILSREIPMITAENCHFWKYVMEKHEERFDFRSYNDVNGILIDAYNPWDREMCHLDFYNKRVHLLKYTKEEVAYGERQLKQMGIDSDYVCIFARDAQYLIQQYNQAYAGNDMRDMSIQDFKLGLEYLATQDIQAVRMGKIVGSLCDLNNCIDYANLYHQDFMDLYLIDKCKFFAGSCSGIVEIAYLQNKPVLIIGLTLFGIWHGLNDHAEDLYIPKKVFDKRTNRFLTLYEMLDAEMAAGDRLVHYYQAHDLIFIDPTQQEIRDAIREMNEKLDGTYQSSDEAERLMQKYFDIWNQWLSDRGYPEYYFCNKLKICESYLLNNQFLLEM